MTKLYRLIRYYRLYRELKVKRRYRMYCIDKQSHAIRQARIRKWNYDRSKAYL